MMGMTIETLYARSLTLSVISGTTVCVTPFSSTVVFFSMLSFYITRRR